MAFAKKDSVVVIQELKMETITVPIMGLTELITNKWSQKAITMIEEKQQKKSQEKRPVRNPEEEYLNSMYRFDDGRYGFRAGAFKAAIVGACRLFKGLPMTIASTAIFVKGERNSEGDMLVEIEGIPYMRTDMVRLESGVADVRYRAGFWPWKACLTITYNSGMVSAEQLVNLVNGSGFGGIGEWRPSAPKVRSGDYGMFAVISD